MKKTLLFLLFLLVSNAFFAQKILEGTVTNQENMPLQNAKIYNTNSGISAVTNSEGNFTISANPGDEIVILKDYFMRKNIRISEESFHNTLKINLIGEVQKIEDVKITYKPTGNLDKDLAHIRVNNSAEILQNEIGLPKLKKPQREEIPTVGKNVLAPLLGGSVNLDAIYKLASGDARRMKRRYAYEDLQQNVSWILAKNGAEFFTEKGIPAERIQEFLEFSLSVNPGIQKMISVGNLSRVNESLNELAKVFLKRMRE